MKRSIIFKLFLFLICSFLISCVNIFKDLNSDNLTPKPGYVVINGEVSTDEDFMIKKSSARTATIEVNPTSYTFFVYAENAEGEKIEGHFTNSSKTSFSLSVPYGRWRIYTGAKRNPEDIIPVLQDTFEKTFSVEDSVFQHRFVLLPQQTSNGEIDLSITVPTEIKHMTATVLSETVSGNWNAYKPETSVTGTTATLKSKTIQGAKITKSGTYLVKLDFFDKELDSSGNEQGNIIYSTVQTINVYDNLTTSVWKNNGGNGCISTEGIFSITMENIQTFISTSFFVGGTNADDTNCGSWLKPMKTVAKAAEKINSEVIDTDYTIFVCDTTYEDKTIEIKKNITIQPYLVAGTTIKRSSENNNTMIVVYGEKTLTLEGLTIDGKSGSQDHIVSVNGAGIYNSGTVTLRGCSIQNCCSDLNGGAIYNTANGSVILETLSSESRDTIITENKADNGAGIYNFGTLTVNTNTRLISNASDNNGGGIYNKGNCFLDGCIIGAESYDNSAVLGAGVYHDSTNTLDIKNNTRFYNDNDIYLVKRTTNGYIYVSDNLTPTTVAKVTYDINFQSTDAVITSRTSTIHNNNYGKFVTKNTDDFTNSTSNGTTTAIVGKKIYVGGQDANIIPVGNDSTGNGSKNAPYKTINKAISAIKTKFDLIYLSGQTLENSQIGINNSVTIEKLVGATKSIIKRDSSQTSSMINISTASSVLTLKEITIDGNGGNVATTTNGAGIYNSGTLNLNSSIIQNCNAGEKNGGAIYCASGTINIDANSVIGSASASSVATSTNYSNTAKEGAGIYCYSSGIIKNNGKINYNYSSSSGAGIYCAGTVTNDGSINYNYAGGAGGGIFCTNSVTNNGIINYNTGYSNGGGIFLNSGTYTQTKTTSQLSNNNATGSQYGANGGGICISNGIATISEGDISGNSASSNGGGIYISNATSSNGKLIFSGGTIQNNSATIQGDGIYQGRTLEMSGGARVVNDYIYLCNDKYINQTGNFTSTNVGTIKCSNYTTNPVVLKYNDDNISSTATNKLITSKKQFDVENSDYVIRKDGAIYKKNPSVTSLSDIQAALAILASGDESNLILSQDIVIPNPENEGIGLTIPRGVSVTLSSSGAKKQLQVGTSGYVDGAIKVFGSLTLENIKITVGGQFGASGAVYVNSSSAEFIMNDGVEISNLSSPSSRATGSPVKILDGKFIMNGGTISNNTVRANGAGVYVSQDGTFEMKGGSITQNRSNGDGGTSKGGGVYVDGGTFIWSDGTISNNTVTTGKVYYCTSGSKVQLKGETSTRTLSQDSYQN